jgi:hypothetical protein
VTLSWKTLDWQEMQACADAAAPGARCGFVTVTNRWRADSPRNRALEGPRGWHESCLSVPRESSEPTRSGSVRLD